MAVALGLINLKGKDSIAAVAKVMHDEDDLEHAENADEIAEANIDTEDAGDGTNIDKKTEE